MKRGILRKTTCLLALTLCLGVASGCAGGSGAGDVTAQEEVKKSSISVEQHCSDLIKLLNEKVQSDTYVDLIATPTLTGSDIFARLRNGNYDAPDKIYKITFTNQGRTLLSELYSVKLSAFDEMSEELKESLQNQILNSYVNVLTGRFVGAERLAMQGMLNAQKLFVAEEKNINCSYLYTYKDAYPINVSIEGSEDGATRANAAFILIDDFKADTADDVIGSMFPFYSDDNVDLKELLGIVVEEIK